MNPEHQCREWIARALRAQTMQQPRDLDQELAAVLLAANEWAVRKGLQQVTAEQVARADQFAAGHADWNTKLPLYVTEAVYAQRCVST